LWVTSAAGGPAFEGSGISCGLPAEPGAIYRVSLENDSFDFAVIADAEPKGICGSGLVDLVACLLRSRRLTQTGRFTGQESGHGFAMATGERKIVLTKRDVDVLQRAKAAIGAGIQALLGKAQMTSRDLRRVCVGGAFGRFLNTENAMEIGLLPKLPSAAIEICGNTALGGCQEALLCPNALERLNILRDQAQIVNLSQCSDFDDLFFENLYLRTWGDSG